MPLTVLSVAFPFAPVSQETAGGAEQILLALDEALVAAGHRSLVVACRGSRVAGTLHEVPLPAAQVLGDTDKAWCRAQVQRVIDHVLASCEVDVIHMHGLDFAEYRLHAHVPTVVTLHLPLAWYPPETWSTLTGQVQLCCVSESQRRRFGRELPNCRVVQNGVALPALPTATGKQNYAVVMGRICPEKNAAAALEAGTAAGTRVLLAGQVFPYQQHLAYLRDTVEPLLQAAARGGVGHCWLGPLAAAERQRLLAGAKCLLHPTLAPETSSLVAMEALAVGTPVIAYRSGALPEIVEDGVTGFLVDSVAEMAAAIGKVHLLSPQVCRRAAQRRFSRARMIESYFEMYERLAAEPPIARRYA